MHNPVSLSSKPWTYGLLLLLLLISTVCLWPGTSGPYLFDDQSNIPKSFIHDFSWQELSAATMANTSGPLKRPVAALSFALTQYTTGPEADGFKIHNIFLHLIIGGVLFFTARKIFSLAKLDTTSCHLAALLCTSFWLLHPLQISTVLYPVQRMAQLSTLFTLLSLLCYLNFRSQADQRKRFLWLLPPCMLLAVFSKENGALIPLLLLLVESAFFRFKTHHLQQKAAILFFIILPLCIGLIYFLTQPALLNYNNRSFSLSERLYTQTWILLDYLKLIVLPSVSDMGIFRDYFPISKTLTEALPALSFHLLAIGLGIFYLKRLPIVGLGILWFYAGHLLESSIFPLELYFEHRNYLPMMGPALLFGYSTLIIKQKNTLKGLAVLLLMYFAFSSFERAQAWRSSISLYQHNASNHPLSARAHVAYANELLVAGDIDLSVQLLLRAGELNPNDAGPLLHLIKVGCFGKLNFRDDFYPNLQQFFSSKPLTAYARQSLHDISKLYAKEQCTYLDRDAFIGVLQSIPKQSSHRRAEMLSIQARLLSKDDWPQANRLYQQSYELNPEPRLLSEQASILIANNKPAQAAALVAKLKSQQHSFSPTLKRDFKDLFAWHDKLQLKAGDTP